MAAVRAVAPAPEADVQSDAYLYWLRGLLWPARVERYGGALLVSGAPAIEHQDVWGRLYAWLLAWADGAPWGGDPGGVPSAPGARGRAGYLEGRPDLLVEVLSPGTAEHDRTTKRRAFAAAGVPH